MRPSRSIFHFPFSILLLSALPLAAQDGHAVTDANKSTVPTTLVEGKPGEYPAFEAIEIAADVAVGYAVTTGDVNADGKPDVVVADANRFWWFENPSWKRHALTEEGRKDPDADPVALAAQGRTRSDNVSIAAGDLDGDGKVDFAAGADWRAFDTNRGGDVLWLQRGADPYKPWTVTVVAQEPTTHRVAVADVDGDRKPEILNVPLMGRGSTKEKNWKDAPVRILAYKVPADPLKDPWKAIVLDASLHVAHNFDVSNPSGAQLADELWVASYDGVFWLQAGPDGTWRKLRLGEGNQVGAANALTKPNPSLGAGEVRVGRLPGGGTFLAAVEPWHGHQAVAYIQGKATKESGWLLPRHVVDDAGMWGHAVACADIRKAGHDDLIVGWRDASTDRKKPAVAAYVPLDATGSKWRKHILEEGVAVESLTVADLNGDGKLDIVAAGRQTHNVKVLLQKPTAEERGQHPPAPDLDAATACAQAWFDAIRAANLGGAVACLAQESRSVPEYAGGPEALMFWQRQITGKYGLVEKGFEGKWSARKGAARGRDVVFAYPVLRDGPSREAIWLVQEDGAWKITVLFNSPPRQE